MRNLALGLTGLALAALHGCTPDDPATSLTSLSSATIPTSLSDPGTTANSGTTGTPDTDPTPTTSGGTQATDSSGQSTAEPTTAGTGPAGCVEADCGMG